MKNPPFSIFPIISGDKIILREVLTADIKDLMEISYYDAIQATTIEQASEMQKKIDKDYINGNSIHWCIANKETNEVIGTCGYYRGFEKEAGELGCVLLPIFRGQGLMALALQLAVDFGLNTIELKRVWAATTKQNIKAIKLLDRLGFTKVGDLIDHEIEYEYKLEV